MQELIIIAADKNMEFALKGILSRPEALGIRPIEFKIRTYSGRDGGVRARGAEILSGLSGQYMHAIVILDWEGSGSLLDDANALEVFLDEQLKRQWGDRAKAVVIDPEVDAWIWGSDNILSEILGVPSGESIRDRLMKADYRFTETGKPFNPKEAIEYVLEELRIPRSSALYFKITSRVSLRRCSDRSFVRLREALQSWFQPADIGRRARDG